MKKILLFLAMALGCRVGAERLRRNQDRQHGYRTTEHAPGRTASGDTMLTMDQLKQLAKTVESRL